MGALSLSHGAHSHLVTIRASSTVVLTPGQVSCGLRSYLLMSSLPLLSPCLPNPLLGSIDLIDKGLTTNRTMYGGMGGILDSQREVQVAGKHEAWPSSTSSEHAHWQE